MKRLLILIALLFSLSTLADGQTPAVSKEELEIKEMERKLSQALTTLDKAALLKLMADEYVSTDSRSVVSNREQEINAFTLPANVTVKSFDIEDMNVRVFEGNTAVVTGLDILRLKYQGEDVNLPFRFTRVYVKRKGQWQIVAQHVTEVPRKQQP
ncbi:MAG TPA: nuclear transport factor 2 family protein [Pyrinomonadaceae bacterium]|nr:nuclear transport factor 2 family protein [Pyrinomonadaceae bacterium]